MIGQYPIQSLSIQTALGRETLRVAEQIDCALKSGLPVPAYLWKELLAALNAHSPDVMKTAFGRVFSYLIEERINGNDGAVCPVRKPGLGSQE